MLLWSLNPWYTTNAIGEISIRAWSPEPHNWFFNVSFRRDIFYERERILEVVFIDGLHLRSR